MRSRRRIPLLSAEAGCDSTATTLVGLVDAYFQRVLAFQLAPKAISEDFDETARRQPRPARLIRPPDQAFHLLDLVEVH
jgi:hypothetical protein